MSEAAQNTEQLPVLGDGLRLVRRIAEGAVGRVFLATTAAGQEVVVKLLRPEHTTDPVLVSRFLDEALLCTHLSHPAVVRYLDARRDDAANVYIVQERLLGCDLRARLRDGGPLPLGEFFDVFLPLCDGLEYVHRKGIVHRDLKPENVFLEEAPGGVAPRLLDFGLAHFRDGAGTQTPAGTLAIDPCYAAPEYLAGKRVDLRADVYALGVVMFEALTGATPYTGATPREVFYKQLEEAPPPLPGSAAVLTAAIHRCLAKHADGRFQSAAALLDALLDAKRESRANGGTLPPELSDTQPSPQLDKPQYRPGDDVGVYEILKLVGEGSMGRVYLSRHKKLGRQVALKMLRPEHARNRELIQRFFQEARAVNQINHEHIVEVFDFVEEPAEARAYCVMEHLIGRPLSQLLVEERLTVGRALGIAAQLGRALEAAHRVGVVHRDIKPDNIFITQRSGISDYVKVLDFGVAKLLTPIGASPSVTATVDGMIIGTPAYMAPEQAAGFGVDHRADIYSAGTVLYEMLAGRRPFDAPTFGQLSALIITQPPPPLPSRTPAGERIPSRLRALVMQCLEKEPGKRPQTMTALLETLAKLQAAPRQAAAGPSRLLWGVAAAGALAGATWWLLQQPASASPAPEPEPVAAIVPPPPPPEPAPVVVPPPPPPVVPDVQPASAKAPPSTSTRKVSRDAVIDPFAN